MPRELPGFYWDEEKRRYFPLSSKPSQPSTAAVKAAVTSKTPSGHTPRSSSPKPSKKTRSHGLWKSSEKVRSTSSGSSNCARRTIHEIVSSQIASTSRVIPTSVPLQANGNITAFCTTSLDGNTRRMIGDSQGWLYSYEGADDNWDGVDTPAHPAPRWLPNLSLTSEITSICMSGSRCVATSYGPSCKIVVQDLSTTEAYVLSPGDRVIHDIWTAHLQDRSLTLGVRKKAIYIRDIDTARSLETLDTQSDVFAVHQNENLVLTGARNGWVKRFDMRIDSPHGQDLLQNKYKDCRSSITYLNVINEWRLLTSTVNGDLEMFDLRFPNHTDPLMTFSGHINSYSMKLPVAIDPSSSFIFAAGQDSRVRAWSLHTGEILHPPQGGPSTSSTREIQADVTNPLKVTFDKPVSALQVTREREGSCLWATSGRNLYQCHLGQRPSWDFS
ncbi:hypothetical protein JAAARDRAFT_66305 [Jaapia argillacea MUCL 33604]|uniref:WD40 repeat-like protein n=1 Tax=Jaapia argillacea MUCL 33604 TaxID=933084 RepID=A0A067Q6L9_9AGAM|nr:hypothetical protein JAAARDRAFT_66305 [Jaapia argillacea MUCL 33604]